MTDEGSSDAKPKEIIALEKQEKKGPGNIADLSKKKVGTKKGTQEKTKIVKEEERTKETDCKECKDTAKAPTFTELYSEAMAELDQMKKEDLESGIKEHAKESTQLYSTRNARSDLKARRHRGVYLKLTHEQFLSEKAEQKHVVEKDLHKFGGVYKQPLMTKRQLYMQFTQ
jgi:hypothetical protein